MNAIAIFLETTNQNLLFGILPESLGLLLFGIGLVVLTIILRWIFTRFAAVKEEKTVKVKN
jgi:uncharacterized membrane protein (DUF485 family)